MCRAIPPCALPLVQPLPYAPPPPPRHHAFMQPSPAHVTAPPFPICCHTTPSNNHRPPSQAIDRPIIVIRLPSIAGGVPGKGWGVVEVAFVERLLGGGGSIGAWSGDQRVAATTRSNRPKLAPTTGPMCLATPRQSSNTTSPQQHNSPCTYDLLQEFLFGGGGGVHCVALQESHQDDCCDSTHLPP